MKMCKNCNSVVPDDSSFCPFCGSSKIEEQREKIKQVSEAVIEDKTQNKNYKTPFFIALAGCIVLGILSISMLNNLPNNYSNLNNISVNNPTGASSENAFQDKYEEIKKIANQDCSAAFHPSSFFVKGTNTKIKIYCNIEESTVEWEGTYYGRSLDTSTYSDWYYDSNGIPYFYLTVKCSDDAYGTITFTNDKNSDKFSIFFSAN